MLQDIEFAIRELAVAIDHVVKVVEDDPFGYDKIPDVLHHAILDLMKAIDETNWGAI